MFQKCKKIGSMHPKNHKKTFTVVYHSCTSSTFTTVLVFVVVLLCLYESSCSPLPPRQLYDRQSIGLSSPNGIDNDIDFQGKQCRMTSSLGEEIKAVIAAALGGSRYGIKIRLPHALVMTLLFRRDQSVSKQVATILILTRDHAINLATFAAIYKVQLMNLFPATPHSRTSKSSHRRTTFPADHPYSVESLFQINTTIHQYPKKGNI